MPSSGEAITAAEVFAILFSVSLVVGVGISLMPQLINILRSKSTVGIAFFTLLFANINSYMTMLNNIMLSSDKMHRCHELGSVECTRVVLVLAQLVVGWVFYVFNYIAYLVYYIDEDMSKAADEEEKKLMPILMDSLESDKTPKVWNRSYNRWKSTGWKVVVGGTGAYIGIVIFLALVCAAFLVLFGLVDPRSELAAEIIGYAASVFVVIQWTPQIYRTIKFKSSGSFSILMILMFVPGTFTIMFFMAVVEHQSFSLWISYLLSGIQMIMLLGLLIWYDYIRPRIFKSNTIQEKGEEGETSTLVNDSAQNYSDVVAGEVQTYHVKYK